MKLINPSFEILEQGPGLDGIYEAIERAGRTCYKSEAKYQYKDIETGEIIEGIPDDFGEYVKEIPAMSILRERGAITKVIVHGKERIFRKVSTTAESFVDRMIASQHYAMLEHGTVYLKIDRYSDDLSDRYLECNYEDNPYSIVNYHNNCYYITTNLRVLVENKWLDDLQYLCEPTEYHEKRVTVRFTTDRGVSHEFVRHRVFSFAQESTRYCNYSKDKFGNELTFIIPSWLDKYSKEKLDNTGHRIDGTSDMFITDELEDEFKNVEARYLAMLAAGCLPQEARQVLPNAIKTELVMTGFVSDWQHFFDLRARGTTGAPHPDAKALAEPLMDEFYKRNLLN